MDAIAPGISSWLLEQVTDEHRDGRGFEEVVEGTLVHRLITLYEGADSWYIRGSSSGQLSQVISAKRNCVIHLWSHDVGNWGGEEACLSKETRANCWPSRNRQNTSECRESRPFHRHFVQPFISSRCRVLTWDPEVTVSSGEQLEIVYDATKRLNMKNPCRFWVYGAFFFDKRGPLSTSTEECTQNWFAIASPIEDTLLTVKALKPKLSKAFLRSDNAGC